MKKWKKDVNWIELLWDFDFNEYYITDMIMACQKSNLSVLRFKCLPSTKAAYAHLRPQPTPSPPLFSCSSPPHLPLFLTAKRIICVDPTFENFGRGQCDVTTRTHGEKESKCPHKPKMASVGVGGCCGGFIMYLSYGDFAFLIQYLPDCLIGK